jgi:hypothetical protein
MTTPGSSLQRNFKVFTRPAGNPRIWPPTFPLEKPDQNRHTKQDNAEQNQGRQDYPVSQGKMGAEGKAHGG